MYCTLIPRYDVRGCKSLRHCDLNIWPKVIHYSRVWASAICNHLAKTASKLVHPFSWNFVHKHSLTHTLWHIHTDKLKWKYNSSTMPNHSYITPWRSTVHGGKDERRCLVWNFQWIDLVSLNLTKKSISIFSAYWSDEVKQTFFLFIIFHQIWILIWMANFITNNAIFFFSKISIFVEFFNLIF